MKYEAVVKELLDYIVYYKEGKANETIKFKKLNPIKTACVYHKGSYSTIGQAYEFIIKWVEENGYKIAEPIRKCYIDGVWNKENEQDYLTEIEVPITKE